MKETKLIVLTLCCTFCCTLLSTQALAFSESKFLRKVEQRSEHYQQLASDNQHLAVEGRISELNTILVNSQPQSKKGAGKKDVYDYFVLANMLYREDSGLSYDLMIKAETLAPGNPLIQFERAIHEHRLGRIMEAATYYQLFVDSKSGRDNPVAWAYLAHCNLLLGRYQEAVNSWAKAEFGSHHTAIEKGMYEVFSTSQPNTEREAIIRSIHTGQADRLCDLVDHDRQWEFDWWNIRSRQDYLTFDQDLATQLLKTGTLQQQAFDLCVQGEEMTNDQYMAALIELGIWGKSGQLPKSPALIYQIVRRLSSEKLAGANEILELLGDQMEAHLTIQPDSRKVLDVLAFLYAQTGARVKLSRIDKIGWQQHGIDQYAVSYVYGLDPKSREFNQTLSDALKAFPNSPELTKLNMGRQMETSHKLESVARYVASEFNNVRNNWSGRYRLGDYMASFQHQLVKQKP